jgi:hypothetical protein
LVLFRPDGEFNPPVLIVDGYNVIGYWAKLKKHFDAGHLDVARERLLSELGEYLHAKGRCPLTSNPLSAHPECCNHPLEIIMMSISPFGPVGCATSQGGKTYPHQSHAPFIEAFWQSTSLRSSGTC